MSGKVVWIEDDHTASDGIYVRLLKARKWSYIFATLLFMHSYGIFHVNKAILFYGLSITIPDWMIGRALLSVNFYVLLQYVMLSVQAVYAYPRVYAERLRERVEEKLSSMNSSLEDERKKIELVTEQMEWNKDEYAQLMTDISHYEQLNLQTPNKYDMDIRHSRFKEMQAKKTYEERYFQVENLNKSIKARINKIEEIENKSPELKKPYRVMEASMDAIRLIPPLIYVVVALLFFGFQKFIGQA